MFQTDMDVMREKTESCLSARTKPEKGLSSVRLRRDSLFPSGVWRRGRGQQ
jgi:hypothetical protein